MNKLYRLEHLDCASCAAKIERNIAKLHGVVDVSVSFATSAMHLELEEGSNQDQILYEIKKRIHALEPDVNLVENLNEQNYEQAERTDSHQENACGHEHSANDHEECGCAHDMMHIAQHGEGCACAHSHEKHNDRLLTGDLKLYLEGLDCANCAAKIEREIQKLPEIKDAAVNFSALTLQLCLQKNISPDLIKPKIAALVQEIEPSVRVREEKVRHQEQEVEKTSFLKEQYKLLLGVILFVFAMLLEQEAYGVWLFIASFLFVGGKVVLTAARNIVKGDVFDENFLMSVATIGAIAIGSYEEAVEVMLFYEIGEMLQSYAVNRSRKNISSLMNIRSDYANILRDGKEYRVDPEEVKIDDIILVKPGERIPLDGMLIKGSTSLDTSALTGESMPCDVDAGQEVLAGSVNLSGVVEVQVTKEFGESTVSRILELVENASAKKAPMEKFITKFARVYTPIVVGLALFIAVLPPLFGSSIPYQEWIYRALTFLVVSCPCALVISIPLGLFAGIGGASSRGILIKGGNYLEALNDVDTVVFDKTGTLTKGSFHVMEVVAQDPQMTLEAAAYGEYYSSHPIAVSIRSSYKKTIDTERISDYEEIAGNGIRVKLDGHEVLLGNKKLMETHQISCREDKKIGTIIHVAKDQQYLGYLVIADEVKETSAAAIQALKQAGVSRCVMLTGDRKETADAVGKQLGLDEVHAQLLPQDKVQKVEELLRKEMQGKKLAFVGDGINDAPVLARADLGVAMGGIGSDAAIEAADIVLMKDDPKALADAIHISKKTKGILWQNIAFSLGVKAAVLLMTAVGFGNMKLGVFADVGVTVLAILNSMRALRIR